MLEHIRQTGVTTDDPEDVNGKDWDAPHVYVEGSIFTLAAFRLSTDDGIFDHTSSARCTTSKYSAGAYQVVVNVANLPIRPGLFWRLFLNVDAFPAVPAAGVTLSYSLTYSGGSTATVSINVLDEFLDNVDPPGQWYAAGLVTCEVYA